MKSSSILTSTSSLNINNNDLLIRETILGVIKSRDLNKEGIIHTSDFRAAVADLGFPFGHPIIENILVHCIINSDGFVDFKGLERELARERRVVNAKANSLPSTRVKTSTETPLKPWRADVVHQQKMQSERQARLLQEKRNDVFDAFRKYEDQQSSEDELIYNIQDLGIVPTTSFLALLRTNRASEIGFGEFMRALINYDPHSKPVDHSEPAGGAASLMGKNDTKEREEHQAGLFYARKRMDLQKKNAMQSSVLDERRTGKRMVEQDQSTYRSRGGGKGGGGESAQTASIAQFIKSSRGAQESLTHIDAPGVGLLSTTQLEMHKGMSGSLKDNISYTSEQKLLREQVLAALRKLDSGVLSAVEFQDIIFTMGIELPEGVLKQLQLQEQSGLLDWRACVQALDGYVFKHRSLVDDVPQEVIDSAKDKLIGVLNSSGSLDSLSKLLQFFSQVDEDGDKRLSYNEFRKACRDFVNLISNSQKSSYFTGRNYSQNQISDSDLRYLFNFFDTNGDGSLSYLEVVASLQGDVSPRRKDIIRQAFVMMDRLGTGIITLETFLNHFNVNAYPDVTNGVKTEWKALKEIQDFFEYCSEGNGQDMSAQISAVTFEMFFKNLSPYIESDEEYFQLIRDMTGLSTKKPPIQVKVAKNGTGELYIPIAKQSFGDMISWNQEQSTLEQLTQERSRQKKGVTPNFPTQTDPILGTGRNETVDLVDVVNLKRTNKASGARELLHWNIPRKQTPTYDTPPKYKTKITITDEPSPDEMFLHQGYRWSEGKKSQYAGGCPYGVDQTYRPYEGSNNSTSTPKKSPNPKSLSEILAAKG